MKYKCIKPYSEYDVCIMDVGDIVAIDKNNLYNITRRVDYNQLYNIEEAKSCLESIVDEAYIVEYNKHPFQKITDKMFETYIAKNHDYGNSFDKSLDKFGLIASAVRIEDKFNRFSNLITKKEAKVNDESLRDTLLDAANYLIMTVMWMDNGSHSKNM